MFVTQDIKRFNLVCHGLMWFWREDNDNLKILIPDEATHVYKIGSLFSGGTGPDPGNLDDLPQSIKFALKGVKRGGMTGTSIARDLCLPCVKRAKVKKNKDARTEILVPIPDLIRAFCHAETLGIDMIDASQKDAVLEMPNSVATCIVLSWGTGSGDPIEVTDGIESFKPMVRGQVANLLLYAQEEKFDIPDPNHGKEFNDILHYVGPPSGPLTIRATDGRLIPDDPPVSTPIGLLQDELKPLASFRQHTTNGSGCVGGGAPEDPGGGD